MRSRAALILAAVVIGCAPTGVASPSVPASTPSSAPSVVTRTPVPSATARADGPRSVVIVGRIVTMDDPPIAEAIFIDDGVVAAVGTKADVLAAAGAEVPVVDVGKHVAYPGFIDAHAHWIGDRETYAVETAAEAIDDVVARGWTSISEQWVNPERLAELQSLASTGALPLRVDAYLALNFGKEFYGDWYADLEPGPIDDHLRVTGVKIHLDNGAGTIVNWDADELTPAIGRADAAGWQVSVHSMSSVAQDMVLDAFEAALGPNGPNPLHHRIEHAAQVTDEQLARMVALDLAVVIHLDGEPEWIMYDGFLSDFDRQDPPADIKAQVGRWRDFVDAGLHVASATDAPWTFPDFEQGDQLVELTDDLGRPFDQIAAGMDGRVRLFPDVPAWLLDQTLTAAQGLRAVTLDAAWALGDETRRGHLAPGTLGDVTILSGDVLDATPDEIRAMTVIATIVGGAPIYCDGSELCRSLGG